jgi:ATP-binding cassette subfamily B protein
VSASPTRSPARLGAFARLIDPFTAAAGPAPQRLWPFLAWNLQGSWPAVWLAMGMSVAVGVSEAAYAWMVGWLIDNAQAKGPGFISAEWVALTGCLAFFVIIRPGLMGLNAATTSLTLQPNLYPQSLARLMRWTLGQSMRFFDDDFAGRIAQKAQQVARAITDVVAEVCNIFGHAVASALAAAAVLGAVSGWLSVALLAWLVAYAALIAWYLPQVRLRSKARASARAAVTGQVVDTITNIATVKLFSHGAHEERAAIDALAGYREATIAFGSLVVGFRFLLFALAGLLPALLIGLTLLFWAQGAATAGDIAMAGLVSTRLAQMSGWVSFAALGIFSNIGEIEDGMRTLSPAHEIADATDARDPGRVTGAIAFRDVHFSYGRGRHAALNGLTLSVRPGEKVGLVGQSGAGKSTVVSLLLRLYDTERGRITIDGADIRSLAQDGLRRQISVVRQETAMFNRSARANIRYGSDHASDAEVIAAAERAAAHDFILRLRDYKGREGYDAHLGERGVKLSGGQRQRIALARAILKDAPILVLDEATSALDSEVEADIQAALAEVMEGKTVIAIAHRLSTIARMDRIVVMDQGRVIEEGTHDALLAKGGTYARFWNRQSGGFLNLQAAE